MACVLQLVRCPIRKRTTIVYTGPNPWRPPPHMALVVRRVRSYLRCACGAERKVHRWYCSQRDLQRTTNPYYDIDTCTWGQSHEGCIMMKAGLWQKAEKALRHHRDKQERRWRALPIRLRKRVLSLEREPAGVAKKMLKLLAQRNGQDPTPAECRFFAALELRLQMQTSLWHTGAGWTPELRTINRLASTLPIVASYAQRLS